MNDSRHHSKRRGRWLPLLLVIGLSIVTFAYWQNDVAQRTDAWITEATRQALVIKYKNVCLISGLEGSDLGKRLFGQRQINVVLFEEGTFENCRRCRSARCGSSSVRWSAHRRNWRFGRPSYEEEFQEDPPVCLHIDGGWIAKPVAERDDPRVIEVLLDPANDGGPHVKETGQRPTATSSCSLFRCHRSTST